MVLLKYLINEKDKSTIDKYEFTSYIHEIAVMLPPTQTLILCNLLYKLYKFNEEKKIKKYDGKDYHFSYTQRKIFEDELGLKKTAFENNLDLLSEYVTFFPGRVNDKLGYKTTFFYLKLDAISNLFYQGRKKLGKDKKVAENENKQAYKRPQQNKYDAAKGTNKKYPQNITNGLKTINENYIKYLNSAISEREYKNTINPIKGLIQQTGYKIIENKELKKWILL